MNVLWFILGLKVLTCLGRTESEECLTETLEDKNASKRKSYYVPSHNISDYITNLTMVVMTIFIGVVLITSFGFGYDVPETDQLYAAHAAERSATARHTAEGYVDLTSVETEADAMVQAMVPGAAYYGEFLYVDGVPERCSQDLDGKGQFYEDWARNSILRYVLAGDAAVETYNSEPTGELLRATGAVLEWRDYGFFTSKLKARYWLIDQNGDGTWDWVARAKTADEEAKMVFLAADGADPVFDGAEAVRLPAGWSGTTKDAQRLFLRHSLGEAV